MAAPSRLFIQTIRDVTIVNFQDASILDSAQIEAIGKEIYHLVDAKYCRKLVLDLSKVQFMSSSALSVLLNVRKKASGIKGDMVVCGLRKELMKIFEMTNLKKLFTFRPDEHEALAVFGITTAG